MFDQDYYNTVAAEEKGYKKWERQERNRILGSNMPSHRKQEKWNELYPRIAIKGLTDEELNQPY